jgi:hypothetical protein
MTLNFNDCVRLEVETQQPTNLLTQTVPGGTNSAGWQIPLEGCTISIYNTSTWKITRNTLGTVQLVSDKQTITPGKSVASGISYCDWNPGALTGANGADVRVGVRYYNASNVQLLEEFGPWVDGWVLDNGGVPITNAFVYPHYQGTAPAFAVKAALVMEAQDTTNNHSSFIKEPVLVQGDTPYEVADTSYENTLPASASNLVINPSGELGAQGWTDYDGNSIVTTRDSLPANAGSYAFNFNTSTLSPEDSEIIVAQTAQGFNALYSNTTEMTAGQWISGRVYAKARIFKGIGGTGPFFKAGWEFRNSSNAVISTSMGTQVTFSTPDDFVLVEAPRMAAPAGTVHARLVVQNSDVSGSFSDIKAYSWMMIKRAQMNVGATEASVTNLPLVSAEKWQNILGPTHSITIDTNEVDTGILSAEILDPLLDPATTEELKPGFKVRLRALVDDVWQTRFYGTATEVSTTYDVDMTNGDLKPRITLQAADPQTILANTQSPNTVATLAGLASQMPSNVLWNINGQTAIGSNPTIVAVNDSATVLDQAIITRDSVGGYVWVDRNGVFNAWDSGSFDFYKTKIWLTDTPRPDKNGRNENVVPNPYFNTDVTGWTGVGGTLSWYSAQLQGQLVATGGTAAYMQTTALIPVEEGQTVSAAVAAGLPQGGKEWKAQIAWYDSSSVEVGTRASSPTNFGQLTGTVPTGAVSCRLIVNVYNTGGVNPSAGTILLVTAVTMIVNPTADWGFEFFDGEGFYAYWTGTPNASSSVLDYGLWQDYLTNFDLAYNSHELINRVAVKGYSKKDDGTYEEIVVGTYEDSASIAEWGVASTEVTIADTSQAATIAARILASNGTPELTCRSITFLAKDDMSLKKAATIDLYDQVHVRIADKFDKAVRVAGVSHVLTATVKNGVAVHRWEVTLTFKGLDTAAVISGSAPAPVGTPVISVPVSTFGGTDILGETSTSFVAGTPSVGMTFVAPLSGIVFVTVDAHLEENTNGNTGYCGFELRDGGTIGSGTVIVAASTDWAVGTSNSVAAGGAARVNGMKRRLVTGLTPGATYNVRTMHLTTPGGSVDVFFRAITVEPWK